MKKAKLLLLMMLAMLGYSVAQAEYTVDFNTPISTTSSDFKVASNWQHIVDVDSYYDNNMSYSYKSDMGINGTGTLLAMKQEKSDWGSSGTPTYDMLVTPIVSGTVTIYAYPYTASSSNKAFVELYSLNSSATAYDRKLGSKEWTSTSGASWTAVTITVSTPQRIGIRAQYVYLDNFSAENANLVTETSLSVTEVMNSDGQTGYNGTNPTFYQQADGNMLAKLKVTLLNNGDVDFVAGSTANYTLTPAYASSSNGAKTYVEDATIDITEDIAAGKSKTFDVTFNVPYVSGHSFWFVRENVTGTTSSSFRYASSAAYEPKFAFRAAGTTTALTDNEAWGVITASTTKSYEIFNGGTAPLTVKSITLPDGFTSDNAPAGQFVVPAGESQAIDITNDASATGQFDGNLVIVYLNKNGAETTYTLALSATVIGANTWWADFNSSKSETVTFPAGSVAEAGIRQGTVYLSAGNYDGYLYSYTSNSYASENNKFITPLLHANSGDVLTFDARRDESASATYNVKVYISTDRKDWGSPVLTVSAADLTSTYQNFSISCPATGDYYVAFAVYGVRIDNIVGLQQVEVDHDMYIKSVNWPDATIKSGTAQTKPVVDVIPLTAEAAADYTVQFIYGDNVVEGTPVALTASNTSSSSKSFSFNWTPVVEQTTAFEDAKVVFTFADGTTIETETYNFTVTNEPKFHFLNSIPSSKWYEPTDRSEPIAFGTTNEALTQNFYIYNWGTAPLTVSAIRLPEGFTASVEAPLTVAPCDENDLSVAAQPLAITFNPTVPGDYSGQLEIVYIDATGAEATFTLPVSGTMLDPAKWYANFDDNALPVGTVRENSVNVTYVNTDDYAITSSATTKNFFITPLLKAEAGETLRFDAWLYNSLWGSGKVTVYTADSRDDLIDSEAGRRTELLSVSGEDADNLLTTARQTFEVTFKEAGNYYIGFEISGRPYVDEIYGLTLVPVEHDWQLASWNIPTQAMQNVPATATVNVRNFGLQDETADDYMILVQVGDKASSVTPTKPLPMTSLLSADGTQLSISFQSPKAGTFPVTIALMDQNGDYVVSTDPLNVTFAEEVAQTDLTIGTNAGTMYDAPLYLNYKNSESVTLYNAETLAQYGLTAGAKIKTITYKGYKTTDPLTTSLQIYYEWTDDQTQSAPGTAYPYPAAANGMTCAVDENHEWKLVGSAEQLGDMIVLDFSKEPLEYVAGKSLRIYMHSYVDAYKTAYFEKSNISTDFSYMRRADAASLSSSWTKTAPAVLHLELDVQPVTLTGIVTDTDDQPVAGATVTLVSDDADDVEYEGVTAADGTYSINVVQTSRTYQATASKEGYQNATEEDVKLSQGSVINFTLSLLPEYVEVTILEGRTGTTLSSQYALDFSDVEGLTAYKAIGKVTTNAVYIITDEVNVIAPAGEGLLLKGASGTYQIPVAQEADADEAAFAVNLLEAALTGYTPTDEDIAAQTVYRYVKVGDECGFQLVTNTSQTLGVGKAYLRLTDELAGAASMYGIIFEEGGVVNSIDTAVSGQLDVNAPMYNLSGQRVERSYRGVVIQNGRKYVKH